MFEMVIWIQMRKTVLALVISSRDLLHFSIEFLGFTDFVLCYCSWKPFHLLSVSWGKIPNISPKVLRFKIFKIKSVYLQLKLIGSWIVFEVFNTSANVFPTRFVKYVFELFWFDHMCHEPLYKLEIVVAPSPTGVVLPFPDKELVIFVFHSMFHTLMELP